MILVPRATHEQPAPQRNASASQHISTSAQPTTNNRKPTITWATDNTTTTTTTTINNTCTVTRAATRNTKQQQQQQLFHHAASQNAPSPASMPSFAHKKKVTGKQKKRHMEPNSIETPSQRQVTQRPQSLVLVQSSETHARYAKNRGGLFLTMNLCASCF